MKSFAQFNFKPKKCQRCGETFTPASGASRYCELCRSSCARCGQMLNGVTHVKRYCDDCRLIALRAYHATRRITRTCLDCGVRVVSGKRCNKHASQARLRETPRSTSWSRWRHVYNGVTYRSRWEVRFAEQLTLRGVPFEYERRDPQTGLWPDFYFPALDRYIELHAACWGPKTLPTNAVLVDNDRHFRAIAMSLELTHFGHITIEAA